MFPQFRCPGDGVAACSDLRDLRKCAFLYSAAAETEDTVKSGELIHFRCVAALLGDHVLPRH
jgi:hypothetical protein